MDRIKSFLGLFPKYLSNSLIVGWIFRPLSFI
jgi:hypothetical protein